MSKVRIRLWTTLTAIVLLVLLLSACAGGEQNKETPANNTPAAEQNENDSKKQDAPVSQTTDNVELRMGWWGSQNRHDRTLAVIDLFEAKYPHITIQPEYTGDGYFDKLNTMIAGGNAPDIIQLGNNYPDYVYRGALLDLTPYLGNQITLDDFSEQTVDSGKLDGKFYAVNLGSNVNGVLYNKTLVEKSGVAIPEDWDWEQYADFHEEVLAALGDGYQGITDQSDYTHYVNYFVRQKGKALYVPGQGAGFDDNDIIEWYTMWQDWRARGIVPDAETAAGYRGVSGIDNSLIVEGKAISQIIWSNQFTSYQENMQDELDLLPLPHAGSGSQEGAWIQPSQFMAANANTKHPEEVALFLNFMVMDPEATAILGNERGVPGSAAAREKLRAEADGALEKMYAYYETAQNRVRAMDREMPGIGEWQTILTNASDQIAFEMNDIASVSAKVVEGAQAAIKKNTE